MATDSAVFGGSTLVVVIGLVIMLYGVTLNAGESMNVPMGVGGIIALAAVAVMALRVARLEPAEE